MHGNAGLSKSDWIDLTGKVEGRPRGIMNPLPSVMQLSQSTNARCTYGRADTTHRKSSRECGYRKELDFETLVWTRGRAFPLSRLEARSGGQHR